MNKRKSDVCVCMYLRIDKTFFNLSSACVEVAIQSKIKTFKSCTKKILSAAYQY